MTAFPDLRTTSESLTAEADRVVCRFDSRGTHLAAFGNIPPTGKTGRVTGQLEFHFAGDKVSEVWVDYDLFGLLGHLGVTPAKACPASRGIIISSCSSRADCRRRCLTSCAGRDRSSG